MRYNRSDTPSVVGVAVGYQHNLLNIGYYLLGLHLALVACRNSILNNVVQVLQRSPSVTETEAVVDWCRSVQILDYVLTSAF